MFEHAHAVLRWISKRWTNASALLRVCYVILSVALVTIVISQMHFVLQFSQLFEKAHPQAQGIILMFLISAFAVCAIFSWERGARVDRLKDDNSQLKTRLDAAEDELAQQQARWTHLLDVEAKAGVWDRPCKVAVPPLPSKDARKTRFLTVLNFKGGVGKTTLTANIAASLGLEKTGLKVLLVDIDFQGTLGHAAVERSQIDAQIRHQSFVNRLLLEDPNDRLLTELKVPMNQVPDVEVILATDTLSVADFQLQAQFFLREEIEPRYQFRKHFNRPEVLDHYDLVIFDCPPRVTTSVVNAMTCSDYVLIPTRLDLGSIDAVPRTYQWMQRFGVHSAAELIGVVACHVAMWRDRLTRADTDSFETLRGKVQSDCGGAEKLFKSFIAHTPRALGTGNGQVASLDPAGREVFARVVAELRKRMKL